MISYLRSQHAGLLALFIALSGTSYAVATGSIDGREVRNSSLTGRDVRNSSLTGRDVRNGRIRGIDLRDGTVRGADVGNGSLTGADLTDTSVGGEDLRDGGVGGADISANAIADDELAAGSVSSDEVRNGTLTAADLAGGVLATNAVARFERFAVAAGSLGVGSVNCAAGQRGLGGGVSFERGNDISNDRVVSTSPRVVAGVATGWNGAIVNGGGAERTAAVWVICASR